MRSYLTQQGYQKLTLQAQNPTDKLRIGSFKVGDAIAFTLDLTSITEPYGATVYTGNASKIRYNTHSDDGVTFRYIADHDVPPFFVGNVVTYLTDGTPFCISYGSTRNRKLATTPTGLGVRWTMQVYLNVPALVERFSFDNLIQEAADFVYYDDEASINFAHGEMHDQAVINNYTSLNKPVPMTNSGNVWWGNPLAVRMDDANYRIRLSGGVAGDGYKYVKDQG